MIRDGFAKFDFPDDRDKDFENKRRKGRPMRRERERRARQELEDFKSKLLLGQRVAAISFSAHEVYVAFSAWVDEPAWALSRRKFAPPPGQTRAQ